MFVCGTWTVYVCVWNLECVFVCVAPGVCVWVYLELGVCGWYLVGGFTVEMPGIHCEKLVRLLQVHLHIIAIPFLSDSGFSTG